MIRYRDGDRGREEIGTERVGIRLSPGANIPHVLETDPANVRTTYAALAEGLAPLNLAHPSILHQWPQDRVLQDIRVAVGAPLIADTGFTEPSTLESAETLLSGGFADAVAVGGTLIANPDLPHRNSASFAPIARAQRSSHVAAATPRG